MYHDPNGDPYQNHYYHYFPYHNYGWQPNLQNGINYHTPYRETQKDFGPAPFVVNINEAAKRNNTFRTAIWTGSHLQVTLMSINVGEDIGLENHPNLDQFLRVEQGRGTVRMGKSRNNLNFVREVVDDSAIMIPAGTWHNVTNTGNTPLKLYSIYAPPQHPKGTVHQTKADAMSAEEHRHFSMPSANTYFYY
jgi:mannose-6-phosphate isomerase-like protein (cupin superfamily)